MSHNDRAASIAPLAHQVGSRIRDLREQAGISQAALAKELYVTRQTVNNWECARTLPDGESLDALADRFGVSVDELMGRDPARAIRAAANVRHRLIMMLAGTVGLFLVYFVIVLVRCIILARHLADGPTGADTMRLIDLVLSCIGLVIILLETFFERRFTREMHERGLEDAVALAAFLEGRDTAGPLPNDLLYRVILPNWQVVRVLISVALIVLILVVISL